MEKTLFMIMLMQNSLKMGSGDGGGWGIKESVLVTPAGLSNRAVQFHRKGAGNYCKIVKI